MEGFDITALASGKDLTAKVQFNDEVTVTVKYVPREKFADLINRATVTTFDRKSHQKQESLDNLKFGELLGQEAVVDWDGLLNEGKPFPCTPENVALLMRKWSEFARFVSDVSTDLERIVEAEKESERKNSGNSSGLTS
jgi:hypothetical protein